MGYLCNSLACCGKGIFMRNRHRDDRYIASKINSILNSIPTNPFIGFSNSTRPFWPDMEDWDEQDYNLEDPEDGRKTKD